MNGNPINNRLMPFLKNLQEAHEKIMEKNPNLSPEEVPINKKDFHFLMACKYSVYHQATSSVIKNLERMGIIRREDEYSYYIKPERLQQLTENLAQRAVK